jgi:hypothetical protein
LKHNKSLRLLLISFGAMNNVNALRQGGYRKHFIVLLTSPTTDQATIEVPYGNVGSDQ